MAKPRYSLNQLVAIHEGLCIESRLRILNLIWKHGPICSRDIETICNYTQSFLGRHLRYLKKRDLIIYDKAFNYHFFSLSPYYKSIISYTLNHVEEKSILSKDLKKWESLNNKKSLTHLKELRTKLKKPKK